MAMKNTTIKIIGALLNAFLLPGLGQAICGRSKKALEIIAISIAIPLCIGAVIFCAVLFQPGDWFVLPVIVVFCFGSLGMFVIWVYALVDVLIGEVKPMGGKQNE